MKRIEKIRWAFFGSSDFSVIVLNRLKKHGLSPEIIVTTPARARGRGLKIRRGPVMDWAERENIRVLAPTTLGGPAIAEELKKDGPWNVFLVAAYGKIIPPEILEIPTEETLNIHPSLLPKLRGPSPVESAILTENETGVTIMKIDEQIDHGPIVAQRTVSTSEWPPYRIELEKILAETGADMFSEILPDWLEKKIRPLNQNHGAATFTRKISKNDLLLNLEAPPEENLRKIRAFSENRGAYFLENHRGRECRIIVERAGIINGRLAFETVKPEGRKKMSYEDYRRGIKAEI